MSRALLGQALRGWDAWEVQRSDTLLAIYIIDKCVHPKT
jgi:hypothetical protein